MRLDSARLCSAGPRGRSSFPQPSRLPRAGGAMTAAVLSCALLACCGCSNDPSPAAPELTATESKLPEQNHFAIAIDFLKLRDDHNLERSARQASYHLNRWTREQTAAPQWMVDRKMINTLPDAIRRAEATRELLGDESLARLEFHVSDVLYLEEARWLQAIARLVEETPPDARLRQWIEDSGLSRAASRQLAFSQAAFDWTIRNIQLDELLEYPKTVAAGPVADPSQADPSASWPPPMRAEPGPGYSRHVWHVLMYGEGDSYQRARVFIGLLRQLHIDAVMLGIDTKVGRARPWLPAAVIDNQLYLFDTSLGLPIPPEPGEAGIATLSQAIAEPSILANLTIGDNYVYPVTSADLESVVALIDAAPEALSQRMVLVEKELSAADQMVLTVTPSELAQRLRDLPGIADVRLWAVPVEASIYWTAYPVMLAQNPEAQWQEFLRHGVFQQLTPLVKGRRDYLLGHFNKQGDEIGAAGHLSRARLTDATLEDLTSSRRVQLAMGLQRPDTMDDEQWQDRLLQAQTLQTQSKQHASYWMGLAHQQQGNYPVAINWLTTRTLEKYPEGPWTNAARYNLARCHEALGEIDEAIQLYRIDESPQRHGNLLRAARLEAAAEKTADTTTDQQPASDPS